MPTKTKLRPETRICLVVARCSFFTFGVCVCLQSHTGGPPAPRDHPCPHSHAFSSFLSLLCMYTHRSYQCSHSHTRARGHLSLSLPLVCCRRSAFSSLPLRGSSRRPLSRPFPTTYGFVHYFLNPPSTCLIVHRFICMYREGAGRDGPVRFLRFSRPTNQPRTPHAHSPNRPRQHGRR